MFISISHHYCKPGQLDAARQRVDKSCITLLTEPGCLYRYRMERPSHPNVVSAITAWKSEEDFERSRQKRFGGGHDLKDTPYEKVESEQYHAYPPQGAAAT